MAVNSLASISQSFLYIYLGMTAFSMKYEEFDFDFVGLTLGAVFVCRIFSVTVPLLLIYVFGGCKPIALSFRQWLFVYFGGLIRGAICFGLSL